MTKKSLRQQYIDDIMSKRYADDDPKYDNKNRDFLEGLSIAELSSMASREFQDDDEEDFNIDSEVMEHDFDNDELFN